MLNSTTSMRKKITVVTSAMCSLVLPYFLGNRLEVSFFSIAKSKKNRESYRQTSSEKNILSLQYRLL